MWGDYKDLNHVLCTGEILSIPVVSWNKSKVGWYKLNVDENCAGNPGSSGARGVICDARCDLLLAFSVNFGHGTNNTTELQRVLQGLKMCCQLGINLVNVETDPQIIVNWLRKKRYGI